MVSSINKAEDQITKKETTTSKQCHTHANKKNIAAIQYYYDFSLETSELTGSPTFHVTSLRYIPSKQGWIMHKKNKESEIREYDYQLLSQI